jgi:hypothetical protein
MERRQKRRVYCSACTPSYTPVKRAPIGALCCSCGQLGVWREQPARLTSPRELLPI